MAFLSGLFKVTSSTDFAEAAQSIVERVTDPSLRAPEPDVAAFRAALEAEQSHRFETGSHVALVEALQTTTALLDEKHFVRAIVRGRELMSRHPAVSASCLNVIAGAFAQLFFYREAVRHYAAAARFEPYFKTVEKNLGQVNQSLRASPSCTLGRLVLAVLSTEAFDAVIDGSSTPVEVMGALLARGEVARRLGAPHLALHDFTRAAHLGEYASTKAMIVLATADLGDREAIDLAPQAKQTPGYVELDGRLSGVLPSAIVVGTPHIDSTAARHLTVYAPLENPNTKILSPGSHMLRIAQ